MLKENDIREIKWTATHSSGKSILDFLTRYAKAWDERKYFEVYTYGCNFKVPTNKCIEMEVYIPVRQKPWNEVKSHEEFWGKNAQPFSIKSIQDVHKAIGLLKKAHAQCESDRDKILAVYNNNTEIILSKIKKAAPNSNIDTEDVENLIKAIKEMSI